VATIHPSAVLDGEINLADDVTIGPGCVLTGRIEIGPGTTLIGSAYLNGPLWVGSRNVIYPFACLGFAPQHLKFDHNMPGEGLRIGDGNIFREHSSVHRAFQKDHPTTIGDRNYFMVGTHAGHDCIVGNDTTIVAGAMLGGHVVIEDRAIIGGHGSVHQFCRVGKGVMMAGGVAISGDVPPYCMVTGNNEVGSVNLIGLRRAGFPREQIDTVRWVHRILYRSGLSFGSAKERIAERRGEPMIDEYLRFFAASKRTLCAGPRKQGSRDEHEAIAQDG